MGKKESLNNTTPRLVKEVPAGYKEEIRNGKKVYVLKKETPIPKEPLPVKPKPTTSVPSGTPRRVPPPKPKPVIPDYNNEEDVVYLEDPTPTQKVQSLRTDLQKITPPGLQEGYHMYKVPDLTKGANYTNARDVITDNEGMPVAYDFKQNKYVQTGEPNVHLSMPVQNDTPTIQDALKTNELPTKFDAVPERLRVPSYNKAKVTTPTVDESIYKGFNEVGDTNDKLNDIEFKKEQEKNLAIPKLKNGGGIMSKIKGYSGGGTTGFNEFNDMSGVIGQNDEYSAQKEEDRIRQLKVARARNEPYIDPSTGKETTQNGEDFQKGASVAGKALGAYGSAYYNSTPTYSKGEATRSAGMSAVSNAGPIGGAIGGSAAIGDKIGKPIKTRSERLDANGNLIDSNKSKRNAIGGSLFSPTKALAYRSDSGNWGDVKGNQYNKYIEGKAKNQIQEVKAANKQANISQIIAARDAGNENPTLTNPYDLSGVTFDENQNMVLANGQQFDKNRPMMNKGGIVSKIKGYSDGGRIKGKGTGKSDSILAKVEADSFVVPEENKEVAEEIREKFLGKPPKSKANLNQKGGEKVKLSNGEHLYTPEEKEELLRKGVNVDLLAPKADVKVNDHIAFSNVIGYAKGGDVLEEDTIDPKNELAKIEAERKAIAAIKAKKESDQTADEKARLQKFILDSRKSDRENKIKDWEKKKSDYKSNLDALSKSYEEMSSDFEASVTPNEKDKAKYPAIKKGNLSESQLAKKESLLKKINETKANYDNADRTYNYVKDDKNYTPAGELKTNSPKAPPIVKATANTGASTNETNIPKVTSPSTGLRVPKTGAKVTVDNLPTKDLSLAGLKQDAELKANANAIDSENSIANAPTRQAVINDSNKSNNDAYVSGSPSKRKGSVLDKIGSIDPTSFIGIGQTALGLNMLSKSKRPIDKAVIDPTYNNAVNRSQEDAKFGLTPEQKFAAEQDIQGGLNDAKFAGLNSSAASSFNYNRAAINDAWKNKLGLKQADFEMRMNKQKYADAMASDRATILASNRRQAFNDAMGAFNQNQQSGSELVGAGIQNTIGAYRFNKIKKQQDELDNERNIWGNA